MSGSQNRVIVACMALVRPDIARPLVASRGVDVKGSLMISSPKIIRRCLRRLRMRYRSHAIPPSTEGEYQWILAVNQSGIARNMVLRGKRRRAINFLRDALCLRPVADWLRVFLAACIPASLGWRLMSRDLDLFMSEGEMYKRMRERAVVVAAAAGVRLLLNKSLRATNRYRK